MSRGLRTVAIRCAICAALCLSLAAGEVTDASRPIRIGLYENSPKLFTDADGEPAGIFVEIINAIAADEGWELEFVPGTWAEGLDRLASGRIDLMPDVAYSAERERLMDFNSVAVLESWSQVYVRQGSGIECLADLDGRRVALLAGSIQETELCRLLAGFGYACEPVPVDAYAEAFARTAAGGAEAAVANHFFGNWSYRDHDLRRTGIVFNPVELHFAAAKGRHAVILTKIDRHIVRMRKASGSAYYRARSRWLDRPPQTVLPSYVVPLLTVLGVGLVLAVVFVVLLRVQVRIRTRHLAAANRALREREKQLFRSRKLETAGRLAAGIGHDFNNLLGAVLGYADLLLVRLKEDDPVREDVEGVREAAVSARDLAGQLLSLGRERPLERRVVAVDELLTGFEALLRQAAGPAVRLEFDVACPDCRVEVDRGQFERALLNLAINARDAMPDGGRLRIAVAREELAADDRTVTPDLPAGTYVAVAVADEGQGMDAATRERLFEPFFTTKAAGEGTGLGLAIVYGVVTRHGGGLRVASGPGRGTTFTLLLPAA